MSFFFSLKNVFKNFLHSGSAGDDSPYFYLSESVSLSLLKDNFTTYRILGWWIFFQYFKYFITLSSGLPLFWQVCCNSHSCSSLIKVFLFVCFLIASFKIFSISGSLKFYYDILRCSFSKTFIMLCVLWDSWICDLISVINFGSSQWHYFKCFLIPFSLSSFGIPIIYILCCLKLSYSFSMFCSTFFIFYSTYISIWGFFINLSSGILILSSAMSSPFSISCWFLEFSSLCLYYLTV